MEPVLPGVSVAKLSAWKIDLGSTSWGSEWAAAGEPPREAGANRGWAAWEEPKAAGRGPIEPPGARAGRAEEASVGEPTRPAHSGPPQRAGLGPRMC